MIQPKTSIIPESFRGLKVWQKMVVMFIGMITVIGPAWTGMIKSFSSNGVESAQAQAEKASAKADLGFELLAQKVELESKMIDEKFNHIEIRISKLETKIDALLMSSSPAFSELQKKVVHVTSKQKEKIKLPDNLEIAYQQRKK